MKPIHSQVLLVTLVLIHASTLLAATTAEGETMEKKAREMCMKDLKLKDDEIQLFKEHKWFGKDAKDASMNMMCYLLCFYKKIGVIDTDGSYKQEVFFKYVDHIMEDKSKTRPTLVKCAAMKSDNECEKAYKYERCVRESI